MNNYQSDRIFLKICLWIHENPSNGSLSSNVGWTCSQRHDKLVTLRERHVISKEVVASRMHCVDISKLYILPKSLNFTCCTVFFYFITLSGNYRWINMFQMMVYRMFWAGFLRIFIFGICYQKSEMTHNPGFFFLTWFSLYFICNIDGEIALTMKYDFNYYQAKINSVLEQGLL